jgi:hypothetical protein
MTDISVSPILGAKEIAHPIAVAVTTDVSSLEKQAEDLWSTLVKERIESAGPETKERGYYFPPLEGWYRGQNTDDDYALKLVELVLGEDSI